MRREGFGTVASRRRSNEEKKKEARKDRISVRIRMAALQVFTEHGYRGASIDDIARRAGVLAGSIYHYYENKEDLFRAVLESIDMIRPVDLADFKSLELTQLVVSATLSLRNPDALALSRLIIMEAHNFPELAKEWYVKMFSPIFDPVTKWVSQAQARGEIKHGDPAIQARTMIAPLIMAMLFQDLFLTNEVDLPNMQKLAEGHLATVMQGLGNRSAVSEA
jgi:AcrR family transcriptional regulator